VLERHLPGFAGSAQMGMAAGLSLFQVAAFAPEQITQERLAAIAADLATLGGDGARGGSDHR
jgi:para-nitrobenzyl esterase